MTTICNDYTPGANFYCAHCAHSQGAHATAATAAPTTIDVNIEDHGSIILLQPVSPAGHDWLAVHVPDGLRFHGSAVICEPRFVDSITRGMVRDGLVVTL